MIHPINQFFQRLSPTVQGYLLVLFTMCVWGSFSLLSRVTVQWQVAIWDVMAMRFGFAALILLPLLWRKKDWRFLFSLRIILLAMVGGVGYSCLVYTGFALAPVVHGAVFLNGMIPVATALLIWLFFGSRPDADTKISLWIIILTVLMMTGMILMGAYTFNLGDVIFLACAFCWSGFGILIKHWQLTPWQTLCGTVMWSAMIYLPIYTQFIGFSSPNASLVHLMIQGLFHGVLVMIVATITYAMAVVRLGAFMAGGLSSLAPFIAAIIAVPLLGETLNAVMALGLIGMGLGTVQPWRWLRKNRH
ncbi:DMT family transporter [Moraxella sp. Tifton1]|uniref:DMT family transporter n=1 Tax=Moraxella oculi TaxID=2940516 RepID=A0ABW8U880_9GAMM|nr:DMT family transporter [Moraxella sp. Tifton1]MCL1622817.1 DMT family transporter [Moraxella sp. Tifton1]